MNSVEALRGVNVSSPTDVSKSTRHRADGPVDLWRDPHALAAMSAASSRESGRSVLRRDPAASAGANDEERDDDFGGCVRLSATRPNADVGDGGEDAHGDDAVDRPRPAIDSATAGEDAKPEAVRGSRRADKTTLIVDGSHGGREEDVAFSKVVTDRWGRSAREFGEGETAASCYFPIRLTHIIFKPLFTYTVALVPLHSVAASCDAYLSITMNKIASYHFVNGLSITSTNVKTRVGMQSFFFKLQVLLPAEQK